MLTGRHVEIARLERLLDDARSGASAALVVHGEPGIGKTALLDALAPMAAGFTVLRAQPLQAESELPFAGLSDLLRPLFPLISHLPPPQAAMLSGALALGPPTPGDRFAAAAATISLLAAGAESSPLLAVVDDAQWLDTPSLEALLFAGRRLGTEGVVLVIGTRNQPWLDDVGIERLALEGLDQIAAAELVTGGGRIISPGVRDRLVAETAGNPLALREALLALTDDQLDGTTPITGPFAVGTTLKRSFAERLERLPADARHAALVVAASDSGDAEEIARALDGVGVVWEALDAAEREGLITISAGRVTFRHPLLRSAAYHAADPGQRRSAHSALAHALSPEQSDRIAWHLAGAAAEPDEGVALLLEGSASSARSRHGYAAAASALAAAARLSPADDDRLRRAIGAAADFQLGGQTQTAASTLAAVLDLSPDAVARADLQRLHGAALIHFRPMMEVFDFLVAEANLVEPFDHERAAAMLAIASISAIGAAEIDRAVETAGRAAHLAMPIGGPVALLAALALGSALTLAGRVPEARAILEPLVPLVATLDPLREAGLLIQLTAHTLSWVEDWDGARGMLEHMISVARASSAITVLPLPLSILSELEFRRGRMGPAYAAGTESVQIALETGEDVASTTSLVTLARVEALLGLESDCREHVAAALAIARRLGAAAVEDYASSVLGALELSLGRPDRALPHLVEFARLESMHGLGHPAVVRGSADLVEAYVRLGRTDEAIRELEALEAQGRATGSRWAASAAARCRGLLADEGAYETVFRRALDLHDEQDLFEVARTELCLGQRRRRSGQRADARATLHEALTRFESLGALFWGEQVRIELGATGEDSVVRVGESLTSLTPQELQVALIVAQGATNAEAAAALFISPKTVEFHLSHVYRKLGVRSRTELAHSAAMRA